MNKDRKRCINIGKYSRVKQMKGSFGQTVEMHFNPLTREETYRKIVFHGRFKYWQEMVLDVNDEDSGLIEMKSIHFFRERAYSPSLNKYIEGDQYE